MGELTIKLTML